ncbi:MAG: glucose dehydrogenase [Planctomycetaceae bacterium]|nr:MAG: glucose dehydrogenase [Planctomycetaceae bacterium]
MAKLNSSETFFSGPLAQLPLLCMTSAAPHLARMFAILLASALAVCPLGELRSWSAEPTPVRSTDHDEVADAADEAIRSLDSIRLPDGWQRHLFAADPLVANVVAFDIDPHGNLYVCETFRQNRGVTDNRGHDETWLLADLASQTVQQRIDYHKRLLGEKAVEFTLHDDRVRRLRDTTGDGRADEAIVVADSFNRLEEGTGAGILVRGNELFFTCIPKLWKLIDDTGDGRADRRIALSDGYGVRVAFRGHDLHGPIIGPDGRLYFSLGDRGHHVTTARGRVLANPVSGSVFRCELDGSGLEVFATGLRNPQELAFNDLGDLFTVDNNSDSGDRVRITMLVRGGDSGWRMHYQYLPDRGPFNREQIWHPYHPKQPAFIVPPIANLGDGPSGLAFDPGTGGDASLRGQFLVCDFRGTPSNSGIRSFRLKADGAFYRLTEHAEPIWGVLATDVAFGPDGAIWVSDWVEGWDGVGKGRIYRFTGPDFDAEQAAEVADLLKRPWGDVDADELARSLGHVDRRVRNESQWELARRGELQRLVRVATDPERGRLARLHGIWGIDQAVRLAIVAGELPNRPVVEESARAALLLLLEDPDEVLRSAAAAAVGQRRIESARDRLVALLDDDSSRVRLHAALGLADLGTAREGHAGWEAVVDMLSENDDRDPILRHAGIVALAAIAEPKQLASLRHHPASPVRRAAVVALRRLAAAEITEFLDDTDPLVKVEAARAIHDEPLPYGQEALADLIRMPTEDDALMRRVLNANYRLGTAESAAALADFAAHPTASATHRMEAIAMLRDWGRPDPRDRVLNDHRPLPERPAGAAKAALAEALPTILKNADEVRELAVSVAARFGIAEVAPVLENRVDDKNQRPEIRAEALRSLARIAPEKAARAASELTDSSQTRLRIAAMETLAEVAPQQSLELIAKGTTSEVLGERQIAWDLAARLRSPRIDDLIRQGMDAYLAGDFPADTALNLIEAAGNRDQQPWAESLREFQLELERENPLGHWWLSLHGGDPRVGADVFVRTQLSCVRCHRVGSDGGEVGPDLSSVGKLRDRRYLLESICLPDAAIAEGFETVVIADDAGQVFTGIVQQQDDSSVRLIQPDGKVISIETESILARQRGKSAMPDDLVQLVTPRELRDLVAYLASLQADPADPDN